MLVFKFLRTIIYKDGFQFKLKDWRKIGMGSQAEIHDFKDSFFSVQNVCGSIFGSSVHGNSV